MTETPTPAAPLSDSDARLYATLAHAGNIIFPAIAPLIFWLIGKDKSSFVDAEAKEALNFGILAVIVYIVSSILMVVIIGFVTWFVMVVLALIFGIQGAMKANKGESYRYPFSLRLIK
jgi:uncharacterized Tic20 family protein